MASDPNSLYPLGSQRTLPTATEDRFARAERLAREEEKRLEVRRLQDTPADIKRRTAAARELGIKPSEVLDVSWAEKAVAAKRQMAEREKYPALARFFDKHPDMAALQLDNTEELSGLAAVWDGLKKAPGRLGVAGGLRSAEMATSSLAYSLSQFRNVAAGEPGSMGAYGVTSAAQYADTRQNSSISRGLLSGEAYLEAQADLASKRYGSSNYITEGVLAGLESVPLTLAALGLTVATRNPGVGAGAIGGLVGLDSAREAQKKGMGDGSAALYGVLQGVPEAAFEMIPMGELLKIGGRGVISGAARYLLAEVPSEMATTVTQSFVDWAMLPENKDRTMSDWASGLPDELARTVLGVIGGGTVTVTTVQGLDRLGKFAQRRQAQREMAAVGKFEGDFLDRLGASVANNTLRAEDPEKFAELMRDFAQDRGVSTVLVPGEAVRDYLQSSDFMGENDPLASYAQAAEEAALSGNDIAIPIETALTVLPGTKGWDALKDDMRLTAGGMSRRQAQALEDSEQAMLDEFRKEAEATDAKAKKQTTAREARIAKITTKLEEDGGFAPAEAARQAELLVARMTTRAARMGRDEAAVDQAVEALRIRQVMPPELQRAMAAQEQDMVVAILRGNAKGSTSRARAAAAELQAVLARQGWTPEQLSDEQLGQVIERLAAAGENDGREYRTDAGAGRGSGGGAGGKYAPLDGATKARGWHGPVRELVDAADEYARRAGIDLKRQAYFVTKDQFDEAFARRIAEAYEAMEHAPNDPAVRAAYEAMIAETRAQYDVLVEFGYSFTFFGNEDDPYEGNPFNAMRDLRDNKTMAVYSTIAGHGSGYSETAVDDNPLLADTGLEWPDQNGQPVKVLANDLFRAVHDAFGHGLEGAGFRYDGEENAWQAHARLFSPAALPALTSETRGQNSWLNFGPRGDENRFAVLDDTTFADQKAGLLPSWAWTENVVPDMERGYEQLAPERDRRGDGVSEQGDRPVAARPSYPRLTRPPVNEDGTVTLDHFTADEGLTQTDPSQWGKSGRFLPDEERSRIGRAPGRTYFGIATERGGYVNEFSSGKHPRSQKPIYRVTARIPFDRLYDMYGDPDDLKAVGRALPKDGRGKYLYNGKAVDGVSLYELLIRDAGYAGYWIDNDSLGLTAAVFEPVEVQPYVPERDDYQPPRDGNRVLYQVSPIATRYEDEARAYREAQDRAWSEWRGWHRRAIDMGADAAGTGPVADLRRIGTPEALALAEEGQRLAAELGKFSAWPVEQVEMFPDEELGDAPDSLIDDYQDTIEIDGEERPTKNSDGDLIATTRSAMEAFWRWFGDSKLVDSEGRPRVWYHGTKSLVTGDRDVAFREFATNFFSSDYRTAKDFSTNGEVFKVYLKAERLAEHDAEGRMWDQVYEPDQYEIDEAMDRYIADQLEEFKPLSAIEAKEGGVWRVFDAPNGEYSEFDDETDAQELYDDAVDRERDAFEEELRDDTAWWELQEKEYLSGGRTTDMVAESDTADGYDVTLIENVDEGSGTTDVAIVLADPRFIKATDNYGTFDPADPRIYLQATWFYSALERAAESVKTERAPAAQWIATLKNAPGVKAEELEWTGIIDWLEAQTGPVDKSQVVETIRRGGIVVREIVLAPITEDDLDPAQIDERVWDRDDEFYDRWEPQYSIEEIEEFVEGGERETRWIVTDRYGDPINDEVYETEDDAREAADDADQEARGEAYNEWESEVRAEVVADLLESEREYGDRSPQWQGYSLSREGDQSYRELLITLPPGEGNNPTEVVTGTHWGRWEDEGVVAHARFFDAFGPNGERILFLDEIQSDWHQRGRDEGYETPPDPEQIAEAEIAEQNAYDALAVAEGDLREVAEPFVRQARRDAAMTGAYGDPITPEGVEAIVAGDFILTDAFAAARGNKGKADAGLQAALAKYEAARDAAGRASYIKEAVENGSTIADAGAAYDAYSDARDAREKVGEEMKAVASKLLPITERLAGEIVDLQIKPVLEKAEREGTEVSGGSPEALRKVMLDHMFRANFMGTAEEPRVGTLAFASEEVLRRNASARESGDPTVEVSQEFEFLRAELLRLNEEFIAAEQLENLRRTESVNAQRGGSIPNAPFKDTWPVLVMKRITAWAAAGGYDQVAWVKEGENNGGMNDNVGWFYGRNLPNMTNKFLKPYKARVEGLRVQGRTASDTPEITAIREQIDAIGETMGINRTALQRHYLGEDMAREMTQVDWENARKRIQQDLDEVEQRIVANQNDIAAIEALLAEPEEGENVTLRGQLRYRKGVIERLTGEAEKHRAQLEKSADFDDLWSRAWKVASLNAEIAEIIRTAPTNLGFKITPELREAAASGFPLFQPDHRNMPRGRILFPGNDDQGAVIELFQGRDLSTLIHESSHLWLEELKADAADPNAPEQIKRDWQIVLDWFKANGHEVRDGIIPVGAHEMWARGGERYMREGKAPSTGLKRAFETFRSWLVSLYKTVRGLNSPLTPEIREVFDRLLATDEEIAEARQTQGMDALFNTAVEAGMSPDEFANYQEQVASARAEAQGRVLEKAMADIAKRETRLGRERRRQIKDQVTKAAEDVPLFKAFALLREERMDRAALVERFGEDVVGQLPSRVPPLYADTGVDPEVIAERAGFATAEDMVNAMVAAEADQKQAKAGGDKRNMKARFIDQMTDQAFAAQYGEPMTPEQMLEEAQDAVANDRQGEVIASEIAALARKTGKSPTPYQIARQWARTRVRQGTYVAEASKQALERHRRAIAAAGREAEQAMLAGDMEAVYRAKQKQMLSSALLSEAKAAHQEVEVARARMERIAKARTMKSVDQDYLEQAHALLEEVELRQRSQRSIERFDSWSAWAQQRASEGYDVVVPDTFMAQIGNTNWTRLPVEQLLGLDAAVKQVIHLGRLKQTLLDNQERRDYEAVKAEIRATAALVGKKEPKSDFAEPGWWDSLKGRVASLDAGLLKAETIFDWLDNGNPNGVFNRYVFRPIARAASREADMLRDFYARHKANLEAIPASTLKTWGDKISTGWVERKTGLPLTLSRQQVIAMALNWGNAGNRQRLVDGYGLSEIGVEQFLLDTLTAEEWQFVQATWDLIGELWPEIAAVERRVNGVEPDKVEAISFNTPHGPMRGGYYPAIYNTQIDRKAQRHAEESEDLFNAKTVKATTRASSTKERSETVKRPILLDLGVITRHMGEVIHDITHREAVIQAHRLLTDPDVLDEIDAVLGREYSEQLRPWVKYVANRWAHERSGNEGFSRFFGKLRANATVVGMGFRFTTITTQLAGYSNSIEYVGAAAMTEAIAKFSASPVETTRFVREKSGEMRNRFDTLDRDINQEIRRSMQPGVKGGAIKTVTAAKTFAFHGIGYMDMVVTVPTWMAAYNKALARGATDEQAIYEGDKAVRLSQGSGDAKDLAAVQRGTGPWGEALKLMTMFYSYMSAFYQRQRRLGRDTARAVEERDIAAFPGLLARAWWLLVVPPLLAEFLAARGPEEDEDWTWWAFRKMIGQSLGAIPLVRDLWEPALARATDQPTFGYRFTPIQGFGDTIINVVGDVGNIAQGEPTTRMTRNVLELVGFSTGLVPGQLATSAQFLVDVGEGEQNPRDAAEWFEGLAKGKIAEE